MLDNPREWFATISNGLFQTPVHGCRSVASGLRHLASFTHLPVGPFSSHPQLLAGSNYRNAAVSDPTAEPRSRKAKTYQYATPWPNLAAKASTARIPATTPPTANQMRLISFICES